LVSPAALSLLTTTFKEGRERNRALGMWSAMAAGGASADLILGGLLTQELSWRFTLFVNVPLGLAEVGVEPDALDATNAKNRQAVLEGRDARSGNPRLPHGPYASASVGTLNLQPSAGTVRAIPCSAPQS